MINIKKDLIKMIVYEKDTIGSRATNVFIYKCCL